MDKAVKQQALQRSQQKKGVSFARKAAGGEAYGFITAPKNSGQTPLNPYVVVEINPELGKQAGQKRPAAKSEAAKAMFAKYRAAK